MGSSVDALIAAGPRPVQIDPTLAAQRRIQMGEIAAQQQERMAQAQTLQAQAQERQAAFQDQQALQKAFVDSGGDFDKLPQLAIQYGARLPAVQAAQAAHETMVTSLLGNEKTRNELATAHHQALSRMVDGISDLPPEERDAAMPGFWQKAAQYLPPDELKTAQQTFGSTDDRTLSAFKATLDYGGNLAKEAVERQNAQAATTKAAAETKNAETERLKYEAGLPAQQYAQIQAQRVSVAPALKQAIAAKDPDAYQQALFSLPHGVTMAFPRQMPADPTEIDKALLTPQEAVQAAQAAATAKETNRHNVASERSQATEAAASALRARTDAQKFTMEYGGDAVKGWAATIAQNPDATNEVPAPLRTAVMSQFTKSTGLPYPKPLAGDAQNQERAARNALTAVQQIQQDLQLPGVQARIGPILGRLGNAEQAAGTAVGLSPEEEAAAQRIRTNMRYLVFQEGKSLLGGRLPQQLVQQLEQSSASPKMDSATLAGAMAAVQDGALRSLDTADQQRFGGQMRPRQARGLPTGRPELPGAVPDAVKSVLGAATVKPGIHTLSDGSKWMKAPDGTITRQ
jgi:hypothetical protein